MKDVIQRQKEAADKQLETTTENINRLQQELQRQFTIRQQLLGAQAAYTNLLSEEDTACDTQE